eukprot:gene26369-3360_t
MPGKKKAGDAQAPAVNATEQEAEQARRLAEQKQNSALTGNTTRSFRSYRKVAEQCAEADAEDVAAPGAKRRR